MHDRGLESPWERGQRRPTVRTRFHPPWRLGPRTIPGWLNLLICPSLTKGRLYPRPLPSRTAVVFHTGFLSRNLQWLTRPVQRPPSTYSTVCSLYYPSTLDEDVFTGIDLDTTSSFLDLDRLRSDLWDETGELTQTLNFVTEHHPFHPKPVCLNLR